MGPPGRERERKEGLFDWVIHRKGGTDGPGAEESQRTGSSPEGGK